MIDPKLYKDPEILPNGHVVVSESWDGVKLTVAAGLYYSLSDRELQEFADIQFKSLRKATHSQRRRMIAARISSLNSTNETHD